MRIIRLGFLVGVLLPIIFFGAVSQRASQTPGPNPLTAASHDSQPGAQVLITIVSKGGSPVSAPAKSDFLIRDDRHSVEVKELRSVKDEPLIFSLLVDASGSMRSIRSSQIAGAIRLFNALSKQGNRGYLILFGDEVTTNDQFVDAPIAEQILNQEDPRGSTALFDAIVHAAKQQLTSAKNYPSSRRAIFLFSDGGDNASRNSLEHTLTVLQREGISVFPIAMPSKKPGKQESANLRALSQNTGGDIVSLDESGDFVSRLVESIDNQYLLSFSAFPAKRHKLHSLEVKSVSQDIEVSAPTQYLAP
ncbi:MAG: VWA domain-containing protein [Acidobacteriia bacterium]|nr:VWA domain-containing protein [Terriglobia bacterium]